MTHVYHPVHSHCASFWPTAQALEKALWDIFSVPKAPGITSLKPQRWLRPTAEVIGQLRVIILQVQKVTAGQKADRTFCSVGGNVGAFRNPIIDWYCKSLVLKHFHYPSNRYIFGHSHRFSKNNKHPNTRPFHKLFQAHNVSLIVKLKEIFHF